MFNEIQLHMYKLSFLNSSNILGYYNTIKKFQITNYVQLSDYASQPPLVQSISHN